MRVNSLDILLINHASITGRKEGTFQLPNDAVLIGLFNISATLSTFAGSLHNAIVLSAAGTTLLQKKFLPYPFLAAGFDYSDMITPKGKYSLSILSNPVCTQTVRLYYFTV